MSHKILLLPGDGIGPEVVAEALKVMQCLEEKFGLAVEIQGAMIGGCAYDACGKPLPDETMHLAQEADAILLGAVGGPQWEHLDISRRPEKGLLGLRSDLGLFANLRPAVCYPALADKSPLNAELVKGLDIMMVRELTGGIYFGTPRGIRTLENGERQGINTLVYNESEIERIGRLAFAIAGTRKGQLVSVDKANVLECTELWRDVMSEISKDYPDVTLQHMYVDNAAMQLVRAPKQFDVMVTTNMFGDILSDCVSVATGSIGMLPSASLDAAGKGLYEPIHGSAPDIACRGIANPLASILSVAMMLRYSLHETKLAEIVEYAVDRVLQNGYRTADIFIEGTTEVGTDEMGDKVVSALHQCTLRRAS